MEPEKDKKIKNKKEIATEIKRILWKWQILKIGKRSNIQIMRVLEKENQNKRTEQILNCKWRLLKLEKKFWTSQMYWKSNCVITETINSEWQSKTCSTKITWSSNKINKPKISLLIDGLKIFGHFDKKRKWFMRNKIRLLSYFQQQHLLPEENWVIYLIKWKKKEIWAKEFLSTKTCFEYKGHRKNKVLNMQELRGYVFVCHSWGVC